MQLESRLLFPISNSVATDEEAQLVGGPALVCIMTRSCLFRIVERSTKPK